MFMAKAVILKKLADKFGMSISHMERDLGLPSSVLNKAIQRNSAIKEGVIDLILEKYPVVNPIWLRTGTGQMLLKDEGASAGSWASPPAPAQEVMEDVGDYSGTGSAKDKTIEMLARTAAQATEAAQHSAQVLREASALIKRLTERIAELEKAAPPLSIADVDSRITSALFAKPEHLQEAVLMALMKLGYDSKEARQAKAHIGAAGKGK